MCPKSQHLVHLRILNPDFKFLAQDFLLCYQFFSFQKNLCRSTQRTTCVTAVILCQTENRTVPGVSGGVSSERCVESGKRQGEMTWELTVVRNRHESWDNGRTELAIPQSWCLLAGIEISEKRPAHELWSQGRGGGLEDARLQRACRHAEVTSQSGEEQNDRDFSPFPTSSVPANISHRTELQSSW